MRMPTSAAAFAREHGFRHVCKIELSGKRLSRMLFCCENERTVHCSEKDSMNSLRFVRVLPSELLVKCVFFFVRDAQAIIHNFYGCSVT